MFSPGDDEKQLNSLMPANRQRLEFITKNVKVIRNPKYSLLTTKIYPFLREPSRAKIILSIYGTVWTW